MGKVRDQGRCGSCYTVAFVTLIESRLRYLGGTAPADLSVQHLPPAQLQHYHHSHSACKGRLSSFLHSFKEDIYFSNKQISFCPRKRLMPNLRL